jgi:transcriptional regulator with XRE-family HTH domain
MATPTVGKLQLGNELRRLRETAGRTPAEAASAIECNVSKISRLELGQSGIGFADLKLLLEFYGDTPEHTTWMIELSRNNRERRRWSGHRAAFPDWFRTYADLERDAEEIRWSELEVIPGLFQTERYMRALFDSAPEFRSPVTIPDAIKTRLERQEILRRSDPPTVNVVMSESCVRRMVGGPDVMAEQLERLVELAGQPGVQLQLRPFNARSTFALTHRFGMLRIPSPGNAPPLEVVYLEDFGSARYPDDQQTLRLYSELWSGLRATAMDPIETRDRLHELARQLTEGPPDVLYHA